MNSLDYHKTRIIPYRMSSASILNLALQHVNQWPQPRPMKVFFGDELFIEGSSLGFTNPAIESGVLNCRALLEFLGLRADKTDRLVQRGRARKDDVVIEHYGLPKVTVEEVTSKYPGPNEEAESAIAGLMYLANKVLAHNTTLVEIGDVTWDHLEIASRGVPNLVISYFYTRLNESPPPYEVPMRPR